MIIARIALVSALLGTPLLSLAAPVTGDFSDPEHELYYTLEDQGGYLSLVDALMATGQYDAKVKELLALNEASREAARQERSVLLPTLEAYAGASHEYNDSRSPFFGNFKERYQSHNAGVRLRQPLFRSDWFDTLDRAKAIETAADIELEMYRMSLMMQVVNVYFDYLAAQSDFDSAQAEASATAEALEDMRKRYDVELVAETDLQEAQARNDMAQANLLQASQQVANAESALHLYTGLDTFNLPPLPDDVAFPALDPAAPQQWVELAWQHSIPVLQARQNLEIARADLDSRKAEYHPRLDLVADVAHNDNIKSANGQKRDSAVVGVELNIPLYSGGVSRSRTRQAAAELRAAEHAYDHEKHTAEMNTRTMFRAVETRRKQVQAYALALRSARSALQAVTNGYEAGTRTITDVLNARSAVTDAEKNHTQARYGFLVALLDLKKTVGVLHLDDFKMVDALLIPASASAAATAAPAPRVASQPRH